jgi:hypothetical protein
VLATRAEQQSAALRHLRQLDRLKRRADTRGLSRRHFVQPRGQLREGHRSA